MTKKDLYDHYKYVKDHIDSSNQCGNFPCEKCPAHRDPDCIKSLLGSKWIVHNYIQATFQADYSIRDQYVHI